MTLIEMLEALEAEISRLGVSNGNSQHAAPPKADCTRAGSLRVQMERAGLTSFEFSSIFGIAPKVLDDWLNGRNPAPAWVQAAIQMLSMIPPSARRKLRIHSPWAPETSPARSHPFSRIEEL